MKSMYRNHNGRARRRGQGIVETALVVSAILLPMTLGILQFGIVVNATNTLTQFAREGGRYAAVHGTETNSDTAIRTYISQVAAPTNIRASDLTVGIAMVNNATRASGNAINVTVTYPMDRKVFLGNFFGLGRNYTAESTFILE